MHEHENKNREHGDTREEGWFISKKSLRLVGGGALGALAAIAAGKALKRARPAVVSAVKEGYAFKEWVASGFEKVREDAEDIAAEARHACYKDLEASQEAIRREKEVLEKLEESVGKRAARANKGEEV